ncbi:MAG: hypothetical protein LBU84_06470 [Prevotella sp.]|jgi:hypothetical protein|nr:hypothetical protein [Prevotella sp.]
MKFNFRNKGKNKVVNYEGAQAYRLSPEWQLYTAAVTSALTSFMKAHRHELKQCVV